jgi:hypothetical protein
MGQDFPGCRGIAEACNGNAIYFMGGKPPP